MIAFELPIKNRYLSYYVHIDKLKIVYPLARLRKLGGLCVSGLLKSVTDILLLLAPEQK